MQVWHCLHVDRHHVCPRRDERLDVEIGVLDHQVDVERQRRHLLDRPNDRWADRDVRDEMSVHDVDVDQVGASALHRRDIAAERREVRRKDGGREFDAGAGHRLTSSEIRSTGPTWVPAAGCCRTTVPAGIPGYGWDAIVSTRKPLMRSTASTRLASIPMTSGIT